jgi:hypothetical protein
MGTCSKSDFVKDFIRMVDSLGGRVEVGCLESGAFTARSPSFEYKNNMHSCLVCGVTDGVGSSINDAIISLAEKMAGKIGHFAPGQAYQIMPLIFWVWEDR